MIYVYWDQQDVIYYDSSRPMETMSAAGHQMPITSLSRILIAEAAGGTSGDDFSAGQQSRSPDACCRTNHSRTRKRRIPLKNCDSIFVHLIYSSASQPWDPDSANECCVRAGGNLTKPWLGRRHGPIHGADSDPQVEAALTERLETEPQVLLTL